MTNSEIIKALRCHIGEEDKRCQICPYTIYGAYCLENLLPDLLKLIDGQIAELKKLKYENEFYKKEYIPELQNACQERIIDDARMCQKLKKSAIQEFAERLKDKSHNYYPSIDSYCTSRHVVLISDIDNLVKEMTEGKE